MRIPSYRALLLCAAPLLVTGCDSLFTLEVEAEEICKTQADVSFPAAPSGTASVQQTLSLPLGDFAEPLPEDVEVTSALRLKTFEVDANTDLSGIERATVSLRKPGSDEVILVGEYRRSGTGPVRQIRLTGGGAVDVLDLAKQSNLDFVFDAKGSLPSTQWTANMKVCAAVKARANYFNLLF
ncbi:hypothetical protein DRW03_14510 [Corallococcus sp. H22C18031201]|uniref:hypothetical protein n=1 Tax=Citreicoccus inhibens TaxID=2849499 RepID=UPI000E7391A5|nr:hypothetical protein [Citreicoccus inhibens]MBU8895443.1 hypothetical protein [Citreicoccus inhibens]RJS22522.1 hypothetical protein DRW03_14510 [Corallococcus sp. H22C18031201]